MTRNNARQIAIGLIYSFDYSSNSINDTVDSFFDKEHYDSLSEEDDLYSQFPDHKQLEYIKTVLSNVQSNISQIDSLISAYSESRKVNRISKTALAVLRCALAEILYMDDIPEAVSINEAVEIAKSYDTPDTISFINGVLGSVSRNELHQD